MKMPRHSPRRTLFVLLLSGAAGILNSQRARAAEPDWPERPVTLHAQEQSLDDFLRQLLQAAGMRALPSDGVQGRISGRFSDSPQKIFEDVVKAYDKLPYYDGADMHVAAGSEIQSRSIRVRPAEVDRFERALNRSKLADRYQTVQLSRADGLIKLRGAPEFVDDAQALIDAGTPGVPGPAQRWGNPQAQAARVFLNTGLDLNESMRFYSFGNYSWSEGTTGFFYRSPTSSFLGTSVPLTSQPGGARFSFRELFPGGFSPEFGATIRYLWDARSVTGQMIALDGGGV